MQLLLLQDGKLMGREPLAIALVKDFNVPLNLMSGDHHTQAFVARATRVSCLKVEQAWRPIYGYN